ncbi:MAG: CHAT domain-containing tetratricopeptide repeat protein [Blastocatellia bacterium]|nr:CHAT domain-containing tetratricopeptide repeat protein [Blastocatellia bacterium]
MSKSLLLLIALAAFGWQEPVTLTAGQPVERQIATGESHAYQVTLTAGQFVRVRLQPRNMDGVLSLSGPSGTAPIQMNAAPPDEEESLSLEVAVAGVYRFVVRGSRTPAPPGTYRIEAIVQSAATPADRKRIAAEGLMLEAGELAKQRAATAPQTIAKLEQAASLWREIGELSFVGHTMLAIGSVHATINRPDKAVEFFEQALASYVEAKNRTAEAEALFRLGSTFGNIGQTERSIHYFERELAVYQALKDRNAVGRVLGNLGLANLMLARNGKALEYLAPALEIARESKNLRNEGRWLSTLGSIYFRMSRYEKAIEYHEQALPVLRAAKHTLGEADAFMALSYAYTELGRGEKALANCEQAIALFREAKYRIGEGNTLVAMGNVHSRQQEFEKALQVYEQALVIFREIKNRQGEGTALNNIGSMHAKLGRDEKAIEYLEQGRVIGRELKNRRSEAFALAELGGAQHRLGREGAIDTLTQGLALAREIGEPTAEVRALGSLAKAEFERGNTDRAHVLIGEALGKAEALRSDGLSPESRAGFLATSQRLYQFNTDLLMNRHRSEPTKGFDAMAVESSERQRARSLLELLAEARADLRQGVDPALVERERELGQKLNEKAAGLMQARQPQQVEALKREIGQLENDYERTQAAIRKSSPRYAALTQPQPLKFKEIQQQLDADTLLLEYALGEQRSHLWAITRDSLASYELPKGAEIQRSAMNVYDLLTARSAVNRSETALRRRARIAEAEAKLPAAAQELSRTLLAPVADQLGNKRLVIVADGALQYVPFGMLPDPATRGQGDAATRRSGEPRRADLVPLIVRHEIINLPSASALAVQRRELAGRAPAPKMLAVIADPVFDRVDARFKAPAAPEEVEKASSALLAMADSRSVEQLAEKSGPQGGVATRRLTIPRLPYTRQEATRLLALAPKGASFGAIDFQASRETVLKAGLDQYRYVHFATHGLMDAERPGLSALVLSLVDENGRPQNGFLRTNDIYNMKLPADLVVLSACQTGLGKEIRGEGMIGLTRGFMYAGAARVVVSLWNVNDQATADLMTKFYEKMLARGERPAAALRAAQVEMWKQKQWQAPYYWAAFVIQGEWK